MLMHEHVFVLSAEIMQNYPEDWGEEEVHVKAAVNRLNELKAVGMPDEEISVRRPPPTERRWDSSCSTSPSPAA